MLQYGDRSEEEPLDEDGYMRDQRTPQLDRPQRAWTEAMPSHRLTKDFFSEDAQKMQEMPPYMVESNRPQMAKRAGHQCAPQCSWQCPPSQECDQSCEAQCAPAHCKTFCERDDANSCETRCGKPQCSVICPPGLMEQGFGEAHLPKGPMCTTVCVPPICRTECGVSNGRGKCHSECDDPLCIWKCKPPTQCPKPKCTLQCTGIKECARFRPVAQESTLHVPSDHEGVTYGNASFDVSVIESPATPYPEFTPPAPKHTVHTEGVPVPAAVPVTVATPCTLPDGPVRKLKLRWASEDESWTGNQKRGLQPRAIAPTWTRGTPVDCPPGSAQ